jgi:hypothetical protein
MLFALIICKIKPTRRARVLGIFGAVLMKAGVISKFSKSYWTIEKNSLYMAAYSQTKKYINGPAVIWLPP